MHNCKKIVLTGPESVGKSTLTCQLAKYYKAPSVSEIARKYVEDLDRPYNLDDVFNIAKMQIEQEQEFEKNSDLLFVDTDLIITKIWLKRVFDIVPDWIDDYLRNKPADFHLLCYPDLPWEYDPVRENPEIRIELFDEYKAEIEKLDIPYFIVTGENEERFAKALIAIQDFLNQKIL